MNDKDTNSQKTLKLSWHGHNLSIRITENVYVRGLEKCKHHMHGRIFLNKGDKSYTA